MLMEELYLKGVIKRCIKTYAAYKIWGEADNLFILLSVTEVSVELLYHT